MKAIEFPLVFAASSQREHRHNWILKQSAQCQKKNHVLGERHLKVCHQSE